MKKSWLALAALTAVGAASAQSSVTLFGVVDTGVRYVTNSGGAHVTQLLSGGLLPSRLGFRGVEDLGGGLKAGFWLEAQLNIDDGSGVRTNSNNSVAGATALTPGTQGLVFSRRSTISLMDSWGEVRLGRDLLPQFLNPLYFDPFGVTGIGTSQTQNSVLTGQIAVRASNSIAYILPSNLNGFYGQATYFMGENLSNSATPDDGDGYAVRLGYAKGPLDLALTTGTTKFAAGNGKQTNFGASWNFGPAKLTSLLVDDRLGSVTGRGGLISTVVPLGTGEFRLAYSRYRISTGAGPLSTKLAAAYIHNLSKRTALYATVAAVRNSRGANASVSPGNGGLPSVNGGSRGMDVGIKHAF